MQLQCFIAMAFEHDDTDKVYDNLIVKALKKFGIKPMRIDREEHNNDIDKEMITKLQKCDLVLADLTYARPSVYFEAGFGAGRFYKEDKLKTIPVIYTCRKDHFKPKEDDPFGNRKIHFDLQMKNIIPWNNTSDRQFLQKLTKRINFVISPMVNQKMIDEEIIKKIRNFNHLSSRTKMKVIFEKYSKQYYKFGYREAKRKSTQVDEGYDFWKGTKFHKSTINEIILFITPNLTKTTIIDLYRSHLRFPRYNILTPGSTKLKNMREQLVVCSFNKVNRQKIMEYLPDFYYDENKDIFTLKTGQKTPLKKLQNWKELRFDGNTESLIAILKKPRNKYYNYTRYFIENDFVMDTIENPRTSEERYKKVSRMKKIPREIRIKIFDNIKFEDELFVRNKQMLCDLSA